VIGGATTPLYASIDYRGLYNGDIMPIWDILGKLLFLADSGWPELKIPSSVLACAGRFPQRENRRGTMKALQYFKQHSKDHILRGGGRGPIFLILYSRLMGTATISTGTQSSWGQFWGQ
jgi:hypothetical protein